MVLAETEAEKVVVSSLKEGRQNGTSRNGTKSVTNCNGNGNRNGSGEAPFTEEDAKGVYQDQYDFFRNELKLTDEQAKVRAQRSAEAWRREVFSAKRE
jgi:hypothetical protein